MGISLLQGSHVVHQDFTLACAYPETELQSYLVGIFLQAVYSKFNRLFIGPVFVGSVDDVHN